MSKVFLNNDNQRSLIGFIIIAIFLIFILNIPTKGALENIKFINIAGEKLGVELAISRAERAQGLSGYPLLAEDKGMLFVFDQSGRHSFWMKDMNFAIDIIWIDENLQIAYIQKDAKPESYPAQFMPDKPAKYVLEVVSGFSEKNNLKIGDKIEFEY
jgi:uncharacterized membrane protein (UPF0127 family)